MVTLRHLALVLLPLGLLLAGCPATSGSDAGFLHVASPKWEEQVIYFIFTDRFANGDLTNDDLDGGEYGPTDKDRYSGGDLQGIIDRLDYIQGLGATAIWITPPVANMWWDPEQKSAGFHGYWARHLKKVDEHEGTLATYQALSQALHRRGMYLIQDVVPNHMGNYFTYTSCDDAGINCTAKYDPPCVADYTASGCDVSKGVHLNSRATPSPRPEQAPFDQNDPADPVQRAAGIYHWTPQITDYGNAYQQWNWAISDLDDLNTENPVVRAALRDSYGYWIREVGVDGFRVDTAKFVPPDFWNDFFYSTDPTAPGIMNVAKATGRDQFHAFGEALEISGALSDDGEKRMLPYYGTTQKPAFPALLGYPLFGDIGSVLGQGNPTANLGYRLRRFMDPADNPAPYLTPTFVDNHDQARFLATSNDGLALIQSMVLIFTIPGIPTVYYGTEQGFTLSRQAMFDGGWANIGDVYRTEIGMYRIIKTLAALRKAHPVLVRGDLEVLAENGAGPGALVYRRQYQGDTALVFLNTSADKTVLVPRMPSGLAPGTVLETWAIDPYADPVTPPLVGADGGVTVALPPRTALIAHATSQVVAPPAPTVTLTVATALEGQTFSGDVTVTGTATGSVVPSSTKLRMVVDGLVDGAAPVTVQGDGSWSVTLPVSQFPVGTYPHTVAFYAPDVNVSTPAFHFTSSVVFAGKTIVVDDPAGDDHGPSGQSYSYPLDSTFNHQMDVTRVTAYVGATTLQLDLTMANVTTSWGPDQGFDHVVFNIYFQLPGGGGVTAMPNLFATTPAGFSWSYGQRTGGWKADAKMFNAVGATATSFGQTVTGPRVKVAGKTISFEYDRNVLGLGTWNGVKVYVSTWDYDGLSGAFRGLSQAGGNYEFGHGNPTDPHIMDEVPPITLSYP